MNKKNLIVFCLVFIFAIPFCIADLDISVDSYDSVTKLAKLRISNTDPVSYSKIMLAVDDRYGIPIVDYLSSNNCVSIPQIIEPGSHNLTLTTKEGKSTTKTLTFSKTEEQVRAEKERTERLRQLRKDELERLAQKTKENLEGQIAEELEKMKDVESVRAQVEKREKAEIEEPSIKKEYLLIGLLVFIVLFACYHFLRKRRFKIFKKLKSSKGNLKGRRE